MKAYQTAQRGALLAFFQANRSRRFTIDDLMRELTGEAVISRSAIYRNLDKMTQDGLLTKTVEPMAERYFTSISNARPLVSGFTCGARDAARSRICKIKRMNPD